MGWGFNCLPIAALLILVSSDCFFIIYETHTSFVGPMRLEGGRRSPEFLGRDKSC